MSFPSSNKIVNINSKQKGNNTVIQAENGYFTIKYYKDASDFYDPKAYISFIKNVEKEVRSSEEYKLYIHYLKTEVGLDYCSVFGNITDDKADIEMHHGPILTLFDIVAIILEYRLKHNLPICTFAIAEIVLREHFNNNVQVVMLSKTAHESVHAGKIFISPSQAFGNINEFVNRYRDGFTQDQIDTFNKYVEIAEKNKTTDNGILQNKLTDWNKQNSVSLQGGDLDE